MAGDLAHQAQVVGEAHLLADRVDHPADLPLGRLDEPGRQVAHVELLGHQVGESGTSTEPSSVAGWAKRNGQ
ncbi:hypothetical protein GCM10025872_15900 [Barrientosiimonas endolithica]|uniref:Uncharacterized protein n=1 Tax=Barrientosiimonas endolithica TaxID=1535208 RepID=A0ABM8HAH1_9MICO|nr:hypothetical protein GCM10025872_15900 [Barrientosiimonas endolithica]